MDQSDRRYLRQQLPPFQLEKPYSFSDDADELREYFTLYGFDQLVEETGARYFVGQIKLGGFRCVGHYWQTRVISDQRAQHTVIVCHGLFDHTGLYLKLIKSLIKAGFSVFMADFPGHGLSEGAPASIDDFSEYAAVVADTSLYLHQQAAPAALSLVGQSTGAAAIMRYLLDQAYGHQIYRIVLLAPLIRPKGWWYIRTAFPLVNSFTDRIRRKFIKNSNDPSFCAFLENSDELQPKYIPLQWLKALFGWVEWVNYRLESLPNSRSLPTETPALLIQGRKDDTVDGRYNIPVVKKLFANTEEIWLADGCHHLVNEAEKIRAPMFAAITRFLKP